MMLSELRASKCKEKQRGRMMVRLYLPINWSKSASGAGLLHCSDIDCKIDNFQQSAEASPLQQQHAGLHPLPHARAPKPAASSQ